MLHSHDIIHRDVTPGNLLISTSPNGATHVMIAAKWRLQHPRSGHKRSPPDLPRRG
jgi:serine/threonine protein kinase